MNGILNFNFFQKIKKKCEQKKRKSLKQSDSSIRKNCGDKIVIWIYINSENAGHEVKTLSIVHQVVRTWFQRCVLQCVYIGDWRGFYLLSGLTFCICVSGIDSIGFASCCKCWLLRERSSACSSADCSAIGSATCSTCSTSACSYRHSPSCSCWENRCERSSSEWNRLEIYWFK